MSEPRTSATPQGQMLIDQWKSIDTCLASWLLALDDFDTWGTWAEDGHSSCVSWLQTSCRMARSTAADKLRVARQLGRRKVLADTFGAGEVSYSQVRALSRVEKIDDNHDRWLLEATADSNMAQLEWFVRHQRRIADQDRPPADLYDKRGLYRQPGFAGGMDRVIIEAPAEEIERLMNVLDAFVDWSYRETRKSSLKTRSEPQPESSLKTVEDEAVSSTKTPEELAGEESSMKTPDEPLPKPGIRARHVDALLDLLEHAAYERHDAIDVERATVGVTVDYDTLIASGGGSADLSSGGVITAEAARRLACDAGIHHIITAASPRSSTSAVRPDSGASRSAAPSRPATDTAAASRTADGAFSRSTTSNGGRTTARRTSTTASRSACTTITSSTRAAGRSPTSPPRASPLSPVPSAKSRPRTRSCISPPRPPGDAASAICSAPRDARADYPERGHRQAERERDRSLEW